MHASQFSGYICLTLVLILGLTFLENEYRCAIAQDPNQTQVTSNKNQNSGGENETGNPSQTNNTDYTNVIAPASAAAITGVATYIGTVKQKNKELELQVQKAKSDKDIEWHKKITELIVQYDTDLRNKRISAYQELWKQLKPLEFFSSRSSLTANTVDEIATKLKDWYYDVGGLFMTGDSNSKYLDINTSVSQLTKNVIFSERDNQLPDAAQKEIRSKAESLRESLIKDVGTREKSIIESTRSVSA